MLQIKLYDPKTEEEKTYTQTFIPARSLRTIFQFMTKIEKSKMNEMEQLDGLVALIADLFQNPAVNFDSIYDGIAADKIADELNDILMGVLGGFAPEGKQEKETESK